MEKPIEVEHQPIDEKRLTSIEKFKLIYKLQNKWRTAKEPDWDKYKLTEEEEEIARTLK